MTVMLLCADHIQQRMTISNLKDHLALKLINSVNVELQIRPVIGLLWESIGFSSQSDSRAQVMSTELINPLHHISFL